MWRAIPKANSIVGRVWVFSITYISWNKVTNSPIRPSRSLPWPESHPPGRKSSPGGYDYNVHNVFFTMHGNLTFLTTKTSVTGQIVQSLEHYTGFPEALVQFRPSAFRYIFTAVLIWLFQSTVPQFIKLEIDSPYLLSYLRDIKRKSSTIIVILLKFCFVENGLRSTRFLILLLTF